MVNNQARSGFTLIEIMVALAIVALLAFGVVPGFLKYLERARVSTTKTSLNGVKQALQAYNIDMSRYPETLRDLQVKPDDEQLAQLWHGPYMEGQSKATPLDSWNNKIQYQLTPEAEHPFELYSYGPKGPGSREGRIDVWTLN